MKEVFGLVVSC